jgi:drug/metabolite transporter (DMT)-like permease
LEQLGVARTALLTVCLPPVLIAGASALVSHLRPSAWTLGALLSALGGLTLVGGGSNAHSPVSDAVPLLGLATGTLAAIAFALLSALARMLAGRIHPLQALSFGFVIGAVLLAPIVVLRGPAQLQASLGAATMGQLVLVLIYLDAVPTALAYIFYLSRSYAENGRLPPLSAQSFQLGPVNVARTSARTLEASATIRTRMFTD